NAISSGSFHFFLICLADEEDELELFCLFSSIEPELELEFELELELEIILGVTKEQSEPVSSLKFEVMGVFKFG
ncbi:hypothetical protein NE647_26815, partial [Blautia coccoides]